MGSFLVQRNSCDLVRLPLYPLFTFIVRSFLEVVLVFGEVFLLSLCGRRLFVILCCAKQMLL